METARVRVGKKVTVAEFEGEVPEGKRFLCWNTKADGTGLNYKPGQTITMTGDVELFAVWGDAIQEDSA